MEAEERIRYVGAWPDEEQRAVALLLNNAGAVRAIGSTHGVDGAAAWTCLRVVARGDVQYVAYRPGQDAVLHARSATALALRLRSDDDVAAPSPVTGDASSASRGGLTSYRLSRVVRFVREHLAHPITVADMAREASTSTFHFARQFKLSVGETPLQFVGRCRIEEAQRLLEGSDLPVHEIARQVGYRSGSHFAGLFRRWTGMTPQAYRSAS